MKLKKWTVQSGKVVPASIFGLDSYVVTAPTKAAAQEKMLLELERMRAFGGPLLVVKNGAFLLLSHCGTHVTAESGDLSRVSESGRVQSSCIGSHATLASALQDASFAYYSSPDYQNHK